MHAVVRSIDLEYDAATASDDPADFMFLARIYAGPSDGPGDESFDVTVCSPEWLAVRCREERFVVGRHLLLTDWSSFDVRALQAFLTKTVESCWADTWDAVAAQVSRLGFWEFEDYTEQRA